MVGYPECLTDPSYAGQIMVCTYALVGNYGVPDKKFWESDRIHATALIVSTYNETPSHHSSKMSLSEWLKQEKIPALEIKDTRSLTLKLREKGVLLGKIIMNNDELRITNGKSVISTTSGRRNSINFRTNRVSTITGSRIGVRDDMNATNFYDPNSENLVAKVSRKQIEVYGDPSATKTIMVFDCGVKNNTPRCLVKRGVRVVIVPWDFDPFQTINNDKLLITNIKKHRIPLTSKGTISFNGVLISNGHGDPKMADKTISTVKELMKRKIPTFGICLGNQILALAAGGDTYKLKFGHRSQNQPCIMEGTKRCYLTTQNHGFAVGVVPKGFKPWFTNANDGTNEGIIHNKLPFMSVQFHPEAAAGPVDTEWLFDYFLDRVK
jgi:carbamoyl-phosphate synthase small subunit